VLSAPRASPDAAAATEEDLLTKPTDDIWLARALDSWRAIDRHLFLPRRDLYGVRYWIFWRRYEELWPFAGAWAAAATLQSAGPVAASAGHLSSFRRGLKAYGSEERLIAVTTEQVGFRPGVRTRRSSGGDAFFDDNAWIALALLQQYRVAREAESLELARRVLAFVLSGWSSETAWSHPGGIRWNQSATSTTRNTCSNAPVAEASAQLFIETGDEYWLDWSRRIYQWVRGTLIDADGLYGDHIDADGTVDRHRWTYNQATMIGAGVLLGAATGEERYIADATATAGAVLGYFEVEKLVLQPAPFNAVLLRNLLLLDRSAPDPRYRARMSDYAESMWTSRRNRATGLFSASTVSPLNGSAPLVEIFALLAGGTAAS
jgi:uncharacterized protein YyaL (SSP411 family)